MERAFEIVRVIMVRMAWFAAGVVSCLLALGHFADTGISRYARDGLAAGDELRKGQAIMQAYLGAAPLQMREARDGSQILLGTDWVPLTKSETVLAGWTTSDYGRYKPVERADLSPRAKALIEAMEGDDAAGSGGLSPYMLIQLMGGALDRSEGWASDPQVRSILAGEIFLAYTREREILDSYLYPARRAQGVLANWLRD